MKTTIDQAMTKVFRQRDRGDRQQDLSVASSAPQMPQAVDAPNDGACKGPARRVELYLDPPQDNLRPARPDVLIPPTDCDLADRQPICPVGDPIEVPMEICESVMTCCDGIPQWSNPFVYQLSVDAPPAETIVPAPADAVDEAVEPDAADTAAEPTESRDTAPGESAQPAEGSPQPSVEASSHEPEPTSEPHRDGSATATPFRPVWEVDCLGLPPICRQIVDTVATDLQRVCQQLSPTRGEQRNLISIDSCTRGEGRTTVALALAHGLAQLGQKILLVDADFGNPSLASQLGLAIRQGWEHSVLEGLPIQECCIHSIGDGFTVLPLGRAVLEANDLGTLQCIQDILAELAEHFDRVLLDNGPGGHTWVALPPERLLAHVVVRSLRQTTASEMQLMLDRIQQANDVLISRVDNFAKPSDLAMARSA